MFICVFLFMTVFSCVSGKNITAQTEGFPEFTWQSVADGSYSKKISSFMTSNFYGRDKWVSVSAGLESGICESIVNGVYISESRLISADNSDGGDMKKTADKINEFIKSYDGAVYFTAVPTSSGVYGNMLPSYLLSVTEKQQIDELYTNLSADIRKIDAYNILKMLSDNYIYYRSDSRWTSYGAFCVYRTVIQKLGFMPVSYDKYTIEHITDDYKGNLYNKTHYMESKPDLLDIYEYSGGAEVTDCIGYDNNGMTYRRSLYDRNAVESDNMYNLYLGEKLPFIKINTSINNDRKLLVIGDDFASCFIPFLIQHYNEIAVVFPECMEKDINYFISPDDYEQALFMFGIDSLENGIF